jgi:hypothetical protein
MKDFSPVSIYNRLVAVLQQNPDWRANLADSVISSLHKSQAEISAEIARYAEYLFSESRWDTAQNYSSITAQAGQLGYKPLRKKSATGIIYMSADPKIHTIGTTINALDFVNSATDDVALNKIAPWTVLSNTKAIVNAEATIVDTSGNNYIFATNNPLETGTVYCKNTIIQGIRKSKIIPIEVARLTAARSRLDPYIYIPVEIVDCEAAADTVTQDFLKVFVNYRSGTREEYRVVDSLHLSTSSDQDVELYADLYNNNLLYLKFNASLGKGKVLSLAEGSGVASIEVEYILTKGAAGNLENTFVPFTITGVASNPNLTLYGISLNPISGGADEEDISSIKEKAPQAYRKTYTTATKEAYESAIKQIMFNGSLPTRVRVFASDIETVTDTATIRRAMTCVSLILPNLDDIVESSSGEGNPFYEIERLLNLYLRNLKAPTDTLKFIPPSYVRFGVGLKVSADTTQVKNLSTLQTQIQDLIDASYGSTSPALDFGRDVLPANIIHEIKQTCPEVRSVEVEVEAQQRLSWDSALWMKPCPEIDLHTCRLNFKFDSLFLGGGTIKGFKDFESGASYTMRVDIMYKKAQFSTLNAFHTSIFVPDSRFRSHKPYFALKDNIAAPIWERYKYEDGVKVPVWDRDKYPMDDVDGFDSPNQIGVVSRIEDGPYQFYFGGRRQRVLGDLAFKDMMDTERDNIITDHTKSYGCLDHYLIYCGADTIVSATDTNIFEGYFEFALDSLYATLKKYAEQDVNLKQQLSIYTLANLKCGNTDVSFRGFIKDVLSQYVDIYVSMRPTDPKLQISDKTGFNNTVLFIDSADSNSTALKLTNLSADKKQRLISVECTLV